MEQPCMLNKQTNKQGSSFNVIYFTCRYTICLHIMKSSQTNTYSIQYLWCSIFPAGSKCFQRYHILCRQGHKRNFFQSGQSFPDFLPAWNMIFPSNCSFWLTPSKFQWFQKVTQAKKKKKKKGLCSSAHFRSFPLPFSISYLFPFNFDFFSSPFFPFFLAPFFLVDQQKLLGEKCLGHSAPLPVTPLYVDSGRRDLI